MALKTVYLYLMILVLATGIHAQNIELNFIIFIADDVSWDDFGCYGNKEVKTPNIDRLASIGTRFTNVYLTASSCSPSRNSIITGRYPHNTGAAELHTQPPIDMVSFPEVLRNHSYYSGQAGKFHMGKYAERGFDVLDRKGADIWDGGEKNWLKILRERPKTKPFFLWLASRDAHRTWGPNEFSGTHDPKNITPPFYLADGEETKTDIAQYYDEIKRFDYYVGEVINEVKNQQVLDNTLIIIMADNGRPFPNSKTRVNDRGMKTPFVVYWPNKIKSNGGVCKSLVSVIDIAPTILKLAGIEVPANFQGYSFDHLLTNPENMFRNYIFAEHNWHDYEAHERMVRNKNFMYIRNSRPNLPQLGPADAIGSPSFKDLKSLQAQGNLTAIQADYFMAPRPSEELYDCRRDSLQLLNVASVPEYQSALKEMRNILKEWMATTSDNIPSTLTRDWYLKEPGYIKTYHHSIRGEMPGATLEATKNNNKGIF
jgi:N-sulfoglucosamine sulfohydrolase